MSQHAVLVHVKPRGDQPIGLDEIEEPLIGAVERAGVGEVDGYDRAIDGSDAVFYLYGLDADALWAVVELVLRQAPLGPGSYAVKRYGEPGSVETRIELA